MIALSMLLFALRGKVGAAVITLCIMLLGMLLVRQGTVKVNPLNWFFSLFLLVFAVVLHVLRSKDGTYYLVAGYIMAAMVLLNDRLDRFDGLWKWLKGIAVFEAAGVYLQMLIPNVYYLLMSILVPGNVVSSIRSRLASGYYTGFTREVSYTMFLICIGLGLSIFDLGNNTGLGGKQHRARMILTSLFLLGALVLSGKRATLLFFVLAVLATNLLCSKNAVKTIKYVLYGLALVIVVILTFPIWSKIPALGRFVELVNYINLDDIIGFTNGRTEIYRSAVKLWATNPWFGIGWGNFKFMAPRTNWYAGFDVHNCYLQILCENGYIAALPYAILLGFSVRNMMKLAKLSKFADQDQGSLYKFLILIQIFFLLYSMSEPILFEYTDYIMYFIAINLTSLLLRNENYKVLGPEKR